MMNNRFWGFQRSVTNGHSVSHNNNSVASSQRKEEAYRSLEFSEDNRSSDFFDRGSIKMQSSTLGGIMLPENTDKGITYNIATIKMDTLRYPDYYTELNFSCNIVTTASKLHLRFQIFKQKNDQFVSYPISSSIAYNRSVESTETNICSVVAYDFDVYNSKCFNYSVFVEVMGTAIVGSVSILNPILIVTTFL